VRVLAILQMLLAGRRATVQDLARRFKTRRQTIYRDLRVLEDVGYPIVGEQNGRIAGRPRLAPGMAGPGRPNLVLTRQELAALMWAAKHAGSRQPFRASLGTAMTKLQALTPSADGHVGAAFESAIAGWDRGSKDYTGKESMILRLVEAIITRRRCRVVGYRSPQRRDPTTFDHDPHHLVWINGGLYSLGREAARGVSATLAVDRITSLELTGDTFTPDPAIDAKRYEAEAFGVIWQKPMTVVVRFRADQAPYVREREWHPSQRLRALPDGGVELTMRTGGRFELVRWLLGWGDAAEVVRPASLRRHVAATLSSARSTYER